MTIDRTKGVTISKVEIAVEVQKRFLLAVEL